MVAIIIHLKHFREQRLELTAVTVLGYRYVRAGIQHAKELRAYTYRQKYTFTRIYRCGESWASAVFRLDKSHGWRAGQHRCGYDERHSDGACNANDAEETK